MHDFLTVGAPHPLQEADRHRPPFPDSYYSGLIAEYTQRRDIFLNYLRGAGLSFSEPQGAYYVLVDISEFDQDDVSFAHWLVREVGVAAVPGSSFFNQTEPRFIRFHFAKRAETLHAAGVRLLGLRERATSVPLCSELATTS